ncbi:2Fe-2S iron-sulfur cluster-binding protein, partial [Burkholderia vietnamiensis]
MSDTRTFEIFRYDPERDSRPYMQKYEIVVADDDRMLLDVLVRLKARDETLSFRRSCREGVCGSDAMNINRKNGLACITNLN